MRIADNLACHCHYYRAQAKIDSGRGVDKRASRVKIAKRFSRLALACVAGDQPMKHRCFRKPDSILEKLRKFHNLDEVVMGTWGRGPFDNDDAADWVAEIIDGDGVDAVATALSNVVETEAEFLDADSCSCAVAAAEVVSAARGYACRGFPEELRKWLHEHAFFADRSLTGSAKSAARKVLSESELCELWRGDSAWHRRMNNLATRLSQPSKVKRRSAKKSRNTKKTRKGARLGDVIEIKVQKGFAYAQYTHEDPGRVGMGELIRVFDKIYKERPATINEVVKCPERFAVFFPVGVATSRGIFPIVGNADIPAKLRDFPTFRIGLEDFDTGEIAWKLTDGKKEWPVKKLSARQRKFPLYELVGSSGGKSIISNGFECLT